MTIANPSAIFGKRAEDGSLPYPTTAPFTSWLQGDLHVHGFNEQDAESTASRA